MVQRYALIAALLISFNLLHSKIIVWDLVGVLFEPNKIKMGGHIVKRATGGNPLNMLKITTAVPSEAHMKRMIKDVLDKIETSGPKNRYLKDDNGDFLSDAFCEYLLCQIPSNRMLANIKQSIEKLYQEGYFKSKMQKKLVASTLETIFTPQLYAHYMHPSKKGLALLKLCAEKRNAHGKRANQMVILSNWDCESFPILRQQKASQQVFQYFKDENIFISGQFDTLEALKPCHWVFNYLIDYKNLKPSDFILIDNIEDNVAAARACGMHAIVVHKHNYAAVEVELKKLGAL